MTKKKLNTNILKISTIVFGVLLLVTIFAFGTISDITKTENMGESVIGDDSVKGNPDAPVTIFEYSDYECPYCARFYSDAYQQIKTNYIDTGKVKLIFKDFPLSFHKNAQKAAEAAECAGEQGKYYEMHDLLFGQGVAGGVTLFKQYATTIGLDREAFDECLDTGSMAAEVQADFVEGQQAGVKGTPAFFIDGEYISGAQPYSVFKKVIDSKL